MASQPITLLSPEEYLASERRSPTKSEFHRGRTYARAGASASRVRIVANLVASLHGQVRGGSCSVFASDLRVKVAQTGVYTYPDVAVVCGELIFDDAQHDTLLNPTLLVEVLSPSTRDYDRGDKFEQYRRIPSFREYLLVAQHACHVEHYVRQTGGGWLLSETERLDDVLELAAIGCRLALADVYERVVFDKTDRA